MKLTIERVALLKALGHVQSVVERRNTIPILSNVLLRADGAAPAGTLALSATDMDLEIVEQVPARIERHGATPGVRGRGRFVPLVGPASRRVRTGETPVPPSQRQRTLLGTP